MFSSDRFCEAGRNRAGFRRGCVPFRPGLREEEFPFGMAMTLDAARQPDRSAGAEPGDRRQWRGRAGTVVQGRKGQFSVAGNTVIFVAGQLEDRACPPAKAQADDDLVAALARPAPGSGKTILSPSPERRHCAPFDTLRFELR